MTPNDIVTGELHSGDRDQGDAGRSCYQLPEWKREYPGGEDVLRLPGGAGATGREFPALKGQDLFRGRTHRRLAELPQHERLGAAGFGRDLCGEVGDGAMHQPARGKAHSADELKRTCFGLSAVRRPPRRDRPGPRVPPQWTSGGAHLIVPVRVVRGPGSTVATVRPGSQTTQYQGAGRAQNGREQRPPARAGRGVRRPGRTQRCRRPSLSAAGCPVTA
jgi:hypothetical protein